MKILFVSFFLFIFNAEVKAQKTVTNQNLYWIRYYNQLKINQKWIWHNEIDDRRFFERNKQHHLIIHSRLHYKVLKNADVALGLTYSLQSPQDPNSVSDLVVPEKRFVQEINLNNPLSNRFSLQHRLRIDERLIRNNNELNLLEGYAFNFRFRYKLQGSYRLNREDATNQTILKISDELMFNAGKQIIYNQFDQNRIYAGLEQGLIENISAEIGYLYWYQQRATGDQFFDRNIIRFTLLHKIDL